MPEVTVSAPQGMTLEQMKEALPLGRKVTKGGTAFLVIGHALDEAGYGIAICRRTWMGVNRDKEPPYKVRRRKFQEIIQVSATATPRE